MQYTKICHISIDAKSRMNTFHNFLFFLLNKLLEGHSLKKIGNLWDNLNMLSLWFAHHHRTLSKLKIPTVQENLPEIELLCNLRRYNVSLSFTLAASNQKVKLFRYLNYVSYLQFYFTRFFPKLDHGNAHFQNRFLLRVLFLNRKISWPLYLSLREWNKTGTLCKSYRRIVYYLMATSAVVTAENDRSSLLTYRCHVIFTSVHCTRNAH